MEETIFDTWFFNCVWELTSHFLVSLPAFDSGQRSWSHIIPVGTKRMIVVNVKDYSFISILCRHVSLKAGDIPETVNDDLEKDSSKNIQMIEICKIMKWLSIYTNFEMLLKGPIKKYVTTLFGEGRS